MQWTPGTLEDARLDPGETHIWLVRTAANSYPELFQFISDAERERAGRFRHETDAALFVTAHALLRRLLARYLNAAAIAGNNIQFRYSAAGRPSLESPTGLDFNISHSGEYALLGFIHGGRIGVDIERIRPDIDWNAIRELLPDDVSRHLLGGPENLESSYRVWARYEALAKATGIGIATHAVAPIEPDGVGWQQINVPRVAGYALAAVIDVPLSRVRLFRWAG